MEKVKKPFYKKWWFWLIVAVVIIAMIVPEDEEETTKDNVEETKEETQTAETSKKEEVNSDEKEEKSDEWDDVKEKDEIVGKSDKDFSEAAKNKPSDVRNDKTGNWKITKISENINIEDYALSYYDLYMEDDEIHFIVNFNYSTTSNLSYMDGLLYLDIHEYVKKEEHDASTLGSGVLLKSYVIYPDGDVQELEEL